MCATLASDRTTDSSKRALEVICHLPCDGTAEPYRHVCQRGRERGKRVQRLGLTQPGSRADYWTIGLAGGLVKRAVGSTAARSANTGASHGFERRQTPR